MKFYFHLFSIHQLKPPLSCPVLGVPLLTPEPIWTRSGVLHEVFRNHDPILTRLEHVCLLLGVLLTLWATRGTEHSNAVTECLRPGLACDHVSVLLVQHQPLPRPAGAPGEGGVAGPGLQVIKLISQETLQHHCRLHLHEIRHELEGGALLTMK